ncbi:MAG: protein tyrosine phosphatase [Eubacterium sp.]
MVKYKKIIFVTETDTSRSPLAAAIMERDKGTLDIEVESRGMVVLFPEPINPKTVAIAAAKGIDIKDYVAVQLTAEDFGSDVLVLVFKDQYKQEVYEEYKEAINVYTIKEFIGESGDVVDPYGGELTDYGEMYDKLTDIVDKLINKLSGKE